MIITLFNVSALVLGAIDLSRDWLEMESQTLAAGHVT
jgi:hypothetical protein